MLDVTLYNPNGKPTIQFKKVFKIEKIQVDNTIVTVRTDKNFQVVEVVDYPELTGAIRGRMYLLEVDRIRDYVKEYLSSTKSKEEV